MASSVCLVSEGRQRRSCLCRCFRFRRGPDVDRGGECHDRRHRQRAIQSGLSRLAHGRLSCYGDSDRHRHGRFWYVGVLRCNHRSPVANLPFLAGVTWFLSPARLPIPPPPARKSLKLRDQKRSSSASDVLNRDAYQEIRSPCDGTPQLLTRFIRFRSVVGENTIQHDYLCAAGCDGRIHRVE
jgi:hypothetical protein